MASRTDTHRAYQDTYPDHNNFPPPRPPPRAYDQYIPPRPALPYREDQNFRASSWRPDERPLPYNTRTPSPPQYEPPRPVDDSWNRAGPSSSTWTDRRPSESWGNGRRRDSAVDRFFEPSDAWKQHHHDTRNRPDEYLPPTWDRYMPPRDTRDYDSSSRSHYSPPSGDRYRPMTDPYDSRDMFPHSRADSYRPSYDADGPWVNTPPQRVTRARSPGFAGRSLPTDDRHYSPPGMPSSSAHYRPHPQRMRHNRIVQRISSTQMRGSPSRNDLSPTGPRYPPDFRSTPDSSQSRNLMANAPSFGRKRSTSPFRKEDESPSKRLRSLSPDRLSSLASSRRSSPCPVLMKDPPAPTPPMDHRSTRVSTEGVDQSADAEGIPGITFTNAALDEEHLVENEMPSFEVYPSMPSVGPQVPPSSVTPPPEPTPRSPTPPTTGVDREPPAIKLTSPITSPAHNVVGPPTTGASEMDVDTGGLAIPDSKPEEPTVPGKQPLPGLARLPERPAEEPPCVAPSVTPPRHPLEVWMDAGENGLLATEQGRSTRSEKTTLRDALIHVVASRAVHDYHRRDERVAPILLSNLSIANPPSNGDKPATTPMQELMEPSRVERREKWHQETLPSARLFVGHRREVVDEKVSSLKAEYLELESKWLEHCAKLDEEAKASIPEDTVTTSGRTTRRSAATLGDAVRSDLEMEQIIASLGNEDLTDANHLAMRNAATLPDMISVTRGHVDFVYDDTNNLVLDAPEFFRQRTGIDDWTEWEKQVFLKAYAAHPKQFGIIAESLPHKTASQCVLFYYLHKKKHIDFRKVIQHYAPRTRKGGRRTDKQRGNALLADIMRHDAEVSHDRGSGTPEAPKKRRPGRPPNPRRSTQVAETPNTTPTPVATPDPEPVQRSRAGRRVSTRAPVIVEDDATEDEPDEPRPAKKRRGRKPKNPTSDAAVQPQSQSEAGGTGTGRRKVAQQVNWLEEDQRLFIELVAQHGDNFKRIASSMPNKTTSQVSSFYKANADKYDLAKVVASAPQRTPTPRESTSGRSSMVPSTRAPTPPSPGSTSKPPSTKKRGGRDREVNGGQAILPNYRGSMGTPPSISTGQRPGFPIDPPVTLPPIGSLLPPMTHPPPPGFRDDYMMSSIIPPPPVHIPSGFMGAFPSAHHETYYNPIAAPIPFGHPAHPGAPPVIMIPEHTGDPPVVHAGATPAQGESFMVRDYQHSRAQQPSVGVIPGLVDIPSYDPQYHQPVIRVQQQDSRQESQPSQFMTGRVLLQTKAYNVK